MYDIFAVNGAVYNVGHNHDCAAVNGFPDTNPRIFHRSMAFTAQATGTLGHDIGNPDSHSTDFYGQPAPSIINWFPDLDIGTYTGQNQGPWSVSGNSQYVVEGGEFLHVNGVAQQGLVRFAIPSIAPNKQGPMAHWQPVHDPEPRLVDARGSVRVAIEHELGPRRQDADTTRCPQRQLARPGVDSDCRLASSGICRRSDSSTPASRRAPPISTACSYPTETAT